MKEINKLTDLISLRSLQKFQDKLAEALNIGMQIIDASSGEEITVTSKVHNFCDKVHGVTHPQCRSLLVLKNALTAASPPYLINCVANLHSFVVPIVISGKTLAYVLGGQVRYNNPDFKVCEETAKKFGVTLDYYLEAYLSIPLFSKDRLLVIAESMRYLINIFSVLIFKSFCEENKAKRLENLNNILEKEISKQGKRLSHVEIKYEELVENLPEIVYSVDKNDVFIALNAAVERVLGYQKKDLLGQSFLTIVDLQDRERLKEAYFEALKGKSMLLGYVFKARTKKGDLRYLSLSSKRTFSPEGELIKIEGIIGDITEEKRLSDAFQKSENKYRELISNAVDIIYTLNSRGIVNSINPVIIELTGFTPEEVIGQHFSNFIYPEDLDKVKGSFRDLATRSRTSTQGLQFRLMKKDGGNFFVELNSKAFYDENGNFTSLEGILRDISSEIKMRKNLLEINERYKSLFNSWKEGVYMADMAGILLTVNKGFLDIFALENEHQAIGKKAAEFYVHPEAREDLQQTIVKNGFIKDFRAYVKRSNGEKFYINITSNLIKDLQGNLIGISGIIKEVPKFVPIDEVEKDFSAKRKYQRLIKKDQKFINKRLKK